LALVLFLIILAISFLAEYIKKYTQVRKFYATCTFVWNQYLSSVLAIVYMGYCSSRSFTNGYTASGVIFFIILSAMAIIVIAMWLKNKKI
jgi:hypothetical protein